MRQPLRGKVTDMGDVIVQEIWHVKGRHRFLPTWHVGAPAETTPADRLVVGVAHPPTGKVDLLMDLQADKKVALALGAWTDEVGNPVDAPAGATVTYTVDDPSVIALTDNGDGTAVAAATGLLGTATVHVDVDVDGDVTTGDLAFTVIAGDAERVTIVAGEPEEVTPDDV